MQHLQAVLSPDELAAVRSALADAPFDDGKLTAGAALQHVKHNTQLRRENDQPLKIDGIVINALARHPIFRVYAQPKRVLAPTFARYETGMAYGAHVDGPVMGGGQPMRTDLSVTVFLADPGDYDGGELMIDAECGTQRFKPPAGDAIVYPTFALHQVAPVTRGQRLVAVTWVQSAVRDPQMRRVLFDMTAALEAMRHKDAASPEAQLVAKSLSNLTRLVADL